MMQAEGEILVVDDDPLLRLGMVCMLRDMGYAPLAARDPGRALPLAERTPNLALLITDYQMPGMNGVELARKLVGERPELQVLIVTGDQEMPDALQPGWRKLSKPFTPYELQRVLGEVTLGRPH
ncbi:MAG: response regulator [Chakrabartia sp.]